MPRTTRPKLVKLAALADVEKLPTVTVRNVELCKTGVWNGRPYTAEEFAEAARTAAELGDAYHVPLKLGHADEQTLLGQEDGDPALGWVENVRAEGGTLYGDYVHVPQKLAQLIDSKAYRNRSCEFWIDTTYGGKKRPFMLKAVSLLGVDAPAVEGLADITSLYNARSQAEAFALLARAAKSTVHTLADGDATDADATSSGGADMSGASIDDIQSAVEDALSQQYPPAEAENEGEGADGPSCNVIDWFLHDDPPYIIVSDQDVDNLWKITLQYDPQSDTAVLGSPIPVKGTYQESGTGTETGDPDESVTGGDAAAGGSGTPDQQAEQQMARWGEDATAQLARGLLRGQLQKLKSGDPADGVNKAITALDALLESTEPAVAGGKGAPDWRAAVRMAKRALAAVRLRGGGRGKPGGPPPSGNQGATAQNRHESQEVEVNLSELAVKLGLPATATQREVDRAIEAATASRQMVATLSRDVTALKEKDATAEISGLLDGAIRAGKLRPKSPDPAKPGMYEHIEKLARSDMEQAKAIVASLPPIVDLTTRGYDGNVQADGPSPLALQLARNAGISTERLSDTRTLAEKIAAQRGVDPNMPVAQRPTLRRFLTAPEPVATR